MTLEYESQFFDFDSISSSSPRTPPDHDILGITSTIMYQDPLNYGQSPPPFADGKQHQQQQQPMYPQSTSPQPDFFTAQSASPPSFPGTPDYNATSFAALTAGSPHWSASSPGSTSVTDGQANPADLQNWTSHPPAAFDNSQQQQVPTAAGSYLPQQHQPQLTASYDDQNPAAETQYFRRASNASFHDPTGAAAAAAAAAAYPSPSHLASFQQQQQQQFYDPNGHGQPVAPAYFTDMRLSSSHSTSSNASSAFSEHNAHNAAVNNWNGPMYEESPFGHHVPDDVGSALGAGSVVGTPASFHGEHLPLPGGLDPLSLQDFDAGAGAGAGAAGGAGGFEFGQGQPQAYFSPPAGPGVGVGPYGVADFSASSEHLNGAQSRQGSGSYGLAGPQIQQHPHAHLHQHPYGALGAMGGGAADSTSSLHSIHSQHSVHSVHSQASQHSLHQQYLAQQQQQQQPLSSPPPPGVGMGAMGSPFLPPGHPAAGNQQPQQFPGLSGGVPVPGQSQFLSGVGVGGLGGMGGGMGMLGGIPGHIAVMHTDDANSKETQFLRRRCFNCRTTDPPSWRRSTLNQGKIVCNKCGLYERTHMRPRPPRFDEMRTGGNSTNGGPSMGGGAPPSLAASSGIPNKPRKNLSKPGSVMGAASGSGIGGGSGGGLSGLGMSPKGGIAKVRKDHNRERSVSNASLDSRRGSFSSSSATSDWDDSYGTPPPAVGSANSVNAAPIPHYNYGPAGTSLYGHTLPYTPHSAAILDASNNASAGIRIPRMMPMNGGSASAPPAGASSLSRPASAAGSSSADPTGENGNGNDLSASAAPSPANTAGVAPTNLTGTPPLLPAQPKKSATWSSGVGIGAQMVSPSSSAPPLSIANGGGGDRSRKVSLVNGEVKVEETGSS